MAIGANPRYLEELRVGGGYGDAVDGGADFENNGNISTDGNVTLKGVLSVGSTPQALTDANGAIDGAKIQAGTVDTTQLANDAVDASKLDETGNYTVNDFSLTGNLDVDGQASLDGAAVEGDMDIFDPALLGSELITNGDMETAYSDEVQTITMTATGGTWTIEYDGGGPSSALAYNESLANVESAIEGLAGITSVTVSGTPGSSYVVTFDGADVEKGFYMFTLDTGSLTGGTATIAHTTRGGVTGSGWELEAAIGDALAFKESGDVYAGSASQKIFFATNTAQPNIHTSTAEKFSVSAGKWYRLQFALKVLDQEVSNIRVIKRNGSYTAWASSSAFTNSAWQLYTYDFQATETHADDMVIWIRAFANKGGTFLLDAVSIKEIAAGDLGVANDLLIGGVFQAAGNGNFDGDLTAKSYADNSPVYVGGNALSELGSIGSKEGTRDGDYAAVDHSSLGELRLVKKREVYQDKATGEEFSLHSILKVFRAMAVEGETAKAWIAQRYAVIEKQTQHRDLGKQIQLNTSAVLELLARVETLEQAANGA